MRVTFNLRKKAFRSGPKVAPITFVFTNEKPSRLRATDSKIRFDHRALEEMFERFSNDLERKASVYQDKHSDASEMIMTRLMRCPSGTTAEPNHVHTDPSDSNEYWCEKTVDGKGVRHGPYIKGDFSLDLVGVRQVEGRYRNGKKHGRWTWRSPTGELEKTADYVNGERQLTKAEKEAEAREAKLKREREEREEAAKAFSIKKKECSEQVKVAFKWNKGRLSERQMRAEIEKLKTGDVLDDVVLELVGSLAVSVGSWAQGMTNLMDDLSYAWGGYDRDLAAAKAPCEAAIRVWNRNVPLKEKKQVERWLESIEDWGQQRKATAENRQRRQQREERDCKQRCQRSHATWLCLDGYRTGDTYRAGRVGKYELILGTCSCEPEFYIRGCDRVREY